MTILVHKEKPRVAPPKVLPKLKAVPAVDFIPPVVEIEKSVKITRAPGQRWVFEFTGPITRRDINRIKIALGVDYSRLKRKGRIQRMKQQRVEFTKKES